jgi:enoyl-CoA hydratase/carnithine racemase
MDTEPRLLTNQRGRVLTVTFNNPPRHFFDEQMCIELDELTRVIQYDDSIGAVIFTGTDRVYMTHLDIPTLTAGVSLAPVHIAYPIACAGVWLADAVCRVGPLRRIASRTPASKFLVMARTYAALRRLNRMDKVVVTAINGMAFGMGCAFALACDIRIIAEDAVLGLPESGLGILAAAGAAQRVVRIAGSGRALGLLIGGAPVTAASAADSGLVHAVVPAQDLQAYTERMGQEFADLPPTIIREIKRTVYDAGTRRFDTATQREAASLVSSATSWQSRRRVENYRHWLNMHPQLNDAVITDGLAALRRNNVLRAALDLQR